MHKKILEKILKKKTIKRKGEKPKQQQVPEYLQTLRPQTAISQPMKSVITAEREHIYNLMNKPTN